MAKLSKGDTSNKVHPDAWERFERAVDVVAKSPPQHRKKTNGSSWIQLNRDALWPQTPDREGDPVPKPFREVPQKS
jgi:hypothetical protein